MLQIKLLNLSKNFISFFLASLLFFQNLLSEEKSIDIWNNKNQNKTDKTITNSQSKEEPKIDISKINQNGNTQIEILESQNNDPPVKLVGLYDPGKNDLSLDRLDGMNFDLIRNKWSVGNDKSVNYIAKFIKN